jgi:hypothetical protein
MAHKEEGYGVFPRSTHHRTLAPASGQPEYSQLLPAGRPMTEALAALANCHCQSGGSGCALRTGGPRSPAQNRFVSPFRRAPSAFRLVGDAKTVDQKVACSSHAGRTKKSRAKEADFSVLPGRATTSLLAVGVAKVAAQVCVTTASTSTLAI